MSPADTLRLILLSSLWGMSFIFMRVAVPEFGPVPLILVRMGVGALLMVPLLLGARYLRLVRDNAGKLMLLGLVNHVLPFSLLALAFLGVYVLSADRLDFALGGDGWFILAVLGATFCYGIATNYSKTYLSHLPVRVLAAGSCAMSGLILLLPGLWLWPQAPISGLGWANGLALAVFSTTLAFLLYFGLIASAGATATSTVTFLVPVSALLWGYLLLDETLSLQVLAGMAITLAGTAIATGMLRLGWPARLARRRNERLD
ncbi:DMT family transporter [Halomonas sp. THAF12]|uniref:DMT family transporter n=1 Tax=Halomonas sp. B23F22_10 TaxID=3459515 RepID=UPI00373E9BD2